MIDIIFCLICSMFYIGLIYLIIYFEKVKYKVIGKVIEITSSNTIIVNYSIEDEYCNNSVCTLYRLKNSNIKINDRIKAICDEEFNIISITILNNNRKNKIIIERIK